MKSKILIVEKDGKILELLSTRMEMDGYEVIQARNGLEALNKTKDSHPDLIILELFLQDMEGYDLCRKLVSDNNSSNIPIIILTTMADTESKLLSLGIGAIDYLVKPYSLTELSAKVRSVLRLREQISNGGEDDRVSRLLKKIKNHPLVTVIVIAGIIVICVGAFSNAVRDIISNISSLIGE